ncbi:hypothetical protein KY334_05805 [Candidatus Woesearchaeota archaeon]|nr:hypothetical protein [Candidatus Woesearchaeota archaeon]
MITNALILASLSNGGFYFIFQKLPDKIKTFMLSKHLWTDLTAAGFTYLLFGSTVTGLLASAMAGIQVSVCILILRNKQVMNFFKRIKENVLR